MTGANVKVVGKVSEEQFKVKFIGGSEMLAWNNPKNGLDVKIGDIVYVGSLDHQPEEQKIQICFIGFDLFQTEDSKRQLEDL